MEQYRMFLDLYIEIMLGSTAFMTIVATLRQTLDKAMPKHQYLVVRFLVEVGLSHVLLAAIALALAYSEFSDVEAMRWTFYVFAGFTIPYLIFHLSRRLRQRAPTPLPTLFVMIGYIAMGTVLVLAAMNQFVPQSKDVIMGYLLWALCGHIIVFFMFLGSFFQVEPKKNEP